MNHCTVTPPPGRGPCIKRGPHDMHDDGRATAPVYGISSED